MFEAIANFLVFDLIGMEANTHLTDSLIFFIADALKISLLMVLVIASISFVRTYLPTHKLKHIFTKSRFGLAHLAAAMLGAVTPFCSCSSIPLFLGFLEAEAPAGVAFAFLVTSPLVNEVVFVLMAATFGWKVAAFYAIGGIILGVISGFVIEKILGKKGVEAKIGGKSIFGTQDDLPEIFKERITYSLRRAFRIFKKMWWIILIGVAIGSAIHGFLPSEFILNLLGEKATWWGVPLATLIGIPIYASSATIVPIIFALVTKGLPLSSGIALMLGAAGLSLPEAIMLRSVISTRALAVFFGVVAVGMMLLSYGFNFVA